MDRHYFSALRGGAARASRDARFNIRKSARARRARRKNIEEEMRRMNYAVDGEHRDPADVGGANSGSQNGSDGDHVLLYQPFFSHANLAPPNVTGAIQSKVAALRSAGVSPVVLQRVGSEKPPARRRRYNPCHANFAKFKTQGRLCGA